MIKKKKTYGVTLTELLVVIAIMAIITLALIPAITGRVKNARIATARTEIKQLVMAEESCAMTTGYYVPLQLLDDISKSSSSGDEDALDLENSSISLIPPFHFYITPPSAPTPGTIVEPSQDNLNDSVAFGNLQNRWTGPYVSTQKTILASSEITTTPDETRDIPLDPWGRPYIFVSPIGVIGTSDNTAETASELTIYNSFGNGDVTQIYPGGTGDYLRGRFAIISLGPNVEWDLVSDDTDNIYHQFGVMGSKKY